MKKENFWKKRKTIISFIITSFVFGIIFIGNQSLTGNLIAEEIQIGRIISGSGIILITCSIILVLYLAKKEN